MRLAWPRLFAKVYHRHAVAASLLLVAAFTVIMFATAPLVSPFDLRGERTDANFYAVVPHGTLVMLFGGVGCS
jgi:hypothetical protein